MLLLLLKNKINMTVNDLFKRDISKRRRKILALIGGGFLFYILFQWTYEIFNVLYFSHSNGILIITNILVLFFFGFFVFLLATGITISVHFLFVSTDLPLLISAPLSSTTIFSYKLIETVFANSSLFFFLGIPIFISYGIVIHASWFYYPFMILNTLIFLTLPVSISFLLALLIIRIIPAARAKEIMAGLLGILSLGIWIVIQLFRVSYFDKKSPDFNPERIEQIEQLSQHTFFEVLPSTWAAKSLVAFSSKNWFQIFTEFFPLVLCTAFLFLVCLSITKSLFKDGLPGSQSESPINKKKITKTIHNNNEPSITRTLFSSIIGTIFLRDLKLLSRDLRLLTNVLILVVMMILFPLIRGREEMGIPIGDYLPFILIIIFSTIVSIQLTSRLIPFEGKSFWLMMLLPQSWYKILLGKFFVGFVFNLISVWIAIFVSCIYFDTPVRIAIIAIIQSFLISFGISIYGLTMGSIFPKFDWDHPKRMLTTGGGLILSLGVLFFICLWVGLIILIYFVGSYLNYATIMSDIIVVLISLLIVSLTTIIGLSISSKKLRNLEWKM